MEDSTDEWVFESSPCAAGFLSDEKLPDGLANKGCNHESAEVRAFLNTLPATYVIYGDRHWQYVSQDKEGGVTEFSCGSGSDSHAEGFSMKNRTPDHRFLRIKGGFLSVDVDRADGLARIFFRHHDVLGKIVHEETFSRQPD